MSFQPHWEEKVWGRAMHLFCSPHAAVSYLDMKAGFRCNRHRHAERVNFFAVHEGAVVIEEWHFFTGGEDPIRQDVTLLCAGSTLTVYTGIWHRFRVLQDARMTEIYWPRENGIVLMSDIERDDVGGPDDLVKLKAELFELGLI